MIFTIAAKELKALFASPLAWMVLTALQLICGFAFLKRLDDFIQYQSQLVELTNPPGVTEMVVAPLFATAAVVMLFAMPLLGMRSIAEERRNRTMVLLTSAPITVTQIVVGKFVGLAFFLALIILTLLAMPLSLVKGTPLDWGLIASLAGGVLLLGMSFAAVSLYISSLTSYPMAAAFGAFVALLGMVLAGEAAGDALREHGWHVAAALAQVFSPLKNFEPLAKGAIDSYSVACSTLLILLFLVLAVRRLDARRLRG